MEHGQNTSDSYLQARAEAEARHQAAMRQAEAWHQHELDEARALYDAKVEEAQLNLEVAQRNCEPDAPYDPEARSALLAAIEALNELTKPILTTSADDRHFRRTRAIDETLYQELAAARERFGITPIPATER